jgi:hypothetical protein
MTLTIRPRPADRPARHARVPTGIESLGANRPMPAAAEAAAATYTLNELPQPHEALAFGFDSTNPLLIRLVS